MSDELKLKPCPFCGQPASLVGWREGGGYRAHVECNSCRNTTARFTSESQAMAYWNRRAPTAEVAELRKALESIASGITGDMLGTVSMTTEDMKSIARKAIAKGGG